LFLHGFKTGGDIRFTYLEAQALVQKESIFKDFLLRSEAIGTVWQQ